ncbi:MAG: hypothetical protein LBN93_09665 [Candidatus Symbiothrix sp.]|jgi:hypothetical protein|nr:hypothetical protein [Candidatus Symbiothrix sp.]
MKKIFFCAILFVLFTGESFSKNTDSLYIRLNQVMRNKEYYAKNKEQNIESQHLLESIDKNRLAERLLPDFYDTYDVFCSRYGQSERSEQEIIPFLLLDCAVKDFL